MERFQAKFGLEGERWWIFSTVEIYGLPIAKKDWRFKKLLTLAQTSILWGRRQQS